MAILKSGDNMPNFTFCTANRENLQAAAVVKEHKKTVFWVMRYMGCTACRYDVHQLALQYSAFTARDAQLFVVMQSAPARVREDCREAPLPFEIICDEEQKIYELLSVAPAESREKMLPGDAAGLAAMQQKMAAVKASGFVHGAYEGNENQLPALFITDETGKVLYAHYAANFVDMPDVQEVLQLLDTL